MSHAETPSATLLEIDLHAHEFAKTMLRANGIDDDPQAAEHFRAQYLYELQEWQVALLAIAGWIGGESQAGVDASGNDQEFRNFVMGQGE